MKKYIIICILTLLLPTYLLAQQQSAENLPKDSLLPEFLPVRNYDLSFLIEDDVYYPFFINNIIELETGYFIEALTTIDNYRVMAYIIIPKNDTLKAKRKKDGRQIKRKETYQLSLRKYFLYPAIGSIESARIHDVMLGGQTVRIASTGVFTYLFTSFNLDGLYVKDSIFANRQTQLFESQRNDIMDCICPFVRAIYQAEENSLLNHVDTNLLKQSLHRYGRYVIGRSPSDFRVYPQYAVELFDWEYWYKISNPNDFRMLFWTMLKKDYKFPKTSDETIQCANIRVDLLYYEESSSIFTIRITWGKDANKQPYNVIVNVKKYDSEYKVVGFNKFYDHVVVGKQIVKPIIDPHPPKLTRENLRYFKKAGIPIRLLKKTQSWQLRKH